MLLWMLRPWYDEIRYLRVLEYITVRSGLALFFAFAVVLVAGPPVIRRLRVLKAAGQIRKARREGAVDVYETHSRKMGTPIMGGVLILGGVLVAVLLLCDWANRYVWVALGMMLGFGGIGLVDDWIEITKKDPRRKGLSGVWKISGQCILGAILATVVVGWLPAPLYFDGEREYREATAVAILFFKSMYPALGVGYIAFVMLVVCASSNAVNLTDGLDGLATGITIITALAMTVIVYLVTRVDYAAYLYYPYVEGGAELTVFLMALVGACMGFLWYNAHPAEVFMGDTGSLALGGLLGTVAVLVRQELILIVIGGIFVLEAVSVILQVVSFRLRGKRVFLMAPIHHHFEKKGWPEAKIISRFWIVSALLALMGLGMLKLR